MSTADAKSVEGPTSPGGTVEAYEMVRSPESAKGLGITFPAGVYQGPHVHRSADKVAMLDSTPIPRPDSRISGGSRSPRFKEHLSEMEDTSPVHTSPALTGGTNRVTTPTSDSPTLGHHSGFSSTSMADAVRKRQHLMSWNNYDAQHASQPDDSGVEATMAPKSPPAQAARSPQQVSPDADPGPSDGRFVVSPHGSVDSRGAGR